MKPAEVIVVGAGFAGIHAARGLGETSCRVTVIDKTNHHLFQPLLYQVATAGLSPADISEPVRAIFRGQPNCRVIWSRITSIEPLQKTVHLHNGKQLSFDYLILAAGARHSYFGKDDWELLAPGLKTVEDALEIRRRVLSSFELAELADDPTERQRLMTFVVIGGGPTGVEMAGAISELSRYALSKDFRRISSESARVVLLEAGPRVLQSFDESLSMTAHRYLAKMGVEVRLGEPVTGLTEKTVLVGGTSLPAGAVIWAAGVQASGLGRYVGECDKAGRVLVNQDLSAPRYPYIFVCGDMAAVSQSDGRLVPGQAPGAIQMGDHAAYNIARLMNGDMTKPFTYHDKGSLATVGRIQAVGEVTGIKFKGIVARLVWIFVHIAYLISFRNRLMVMTEWMWSFVTFRRGARLITDDFYRIVMARRGQQDVQMPKEPSPFT